jgi:hypothetical protein
MNINADVFSLVTECTQMYKNMLISKLSHEGSCKIVIRYELLMSGVDDNHIIYNIYIYGKSFAHFTTWLAHFPPVLLYTKSWDGVNISAQGFWYLAFLCKFSLSCPQVYL